MESSQIQIRSRHLIRQYDADSGVDYLDSLPPGYRFQPTDDELIVHYLMRKLNNETLYPSRIHEAKVYSSSPHILAGQYRPTDGPAWFFFTPRGRKYMNGLQPDRAAGNGYWKASGSEKDVVDTDGNQVGKKRTLVFYVGRIKTNWIMHEYRVDDPSEDIRGQDNNMQLDKCVLCRIYRGTRSERNDETLNVPPIQSVQPSQNEIPRLISTSQAQAQGNMETPIQPIQPREDQIYPISNEFMSSIIPAHQMNSISTGFIPSFNLQSTGLNSDNYQSMYMLNSNGSSSNVHANNSMEAGLINGQVYFNYQEEETDPYNSEFASLSDGFDPISAEDMLEPFDDEEWKTFLSDECPDFDDHSPDN